MPHLALVPFTGLRVREEEVLALGMSLPGLRERGAAMAQLPALGLLTLAGMLPDDWTCSYHAADRLNEELLSRVIDEQPALVAVSALTASVNEAYQFSERLRGAGVQTVLGGLHATACPAEAGRFFDSVVVGDGEPVWHELLHDAQQKCLKREYRPTRPFDLSYSPLPRYDLLGPGTPSRFTLQTQRGCPLRCDFCAASRLLGAFREKPVANIARELTTIRRFGSPPLVELADDNTFAGTRDADELLEALRLSEARYFTEVDWRIGTRPDVLHGLARSGCVQVLMGIESLTFAYSGMGPKRANPAEMMDAVRAVQEAGVTVNGCFIVGSDGETRASIDRLARFILDSPLGEVQITLQTPFPGTALRERLARQGRLLPDRGWECHTLFDVTYQPDAMSVAELELAFVELIKTVFSGEATRRRREIRHEIWQKNPRLHKL